MTPRNLPLEPALVTRVLPLAFSTMVGAGMPSWVWPPKITSMPVTRDAILRSTSMPLWEITTTRSGFSSSRTWSTTSCMWPSWMPKVQSGMNRCGLAMGV